MTNFYCLTNGKDEYKDTDLISFNKVAVYGKHVLNKIIITDDKLVIEADYDKGILLVNGKVVKEVKNPKILRPVCIRRNTVNLNPFKVVGRKFGLGWQYTIDEKNSKDIVLFLKDEFVLVDKWLLEV